MSRSKSGTVGRPLAEFVFMIHVAEVERLLEISGRQQRSVDADVINRAAVVFLMAAWQTYVEFLADDKFAHRLSTPSPQKIDALFEKGLGIRAVSQSWRWRGMTADGARHRLSEILALRHQIAHKARVKRRVRRSTVVGYLHFVHRLAVCLYNFTASYVATQKGGRAPARLKYRGRIGELS